VYCSTKQIKVSAGSGTGTLRFASKTPPVCKDGAIAAKGNGMYEITIQKDKKYTVVYSAL
jgi:hypothetical protein